MGTPEEEERINERATKNQWNKVEKRPESDEGKISEQEDRRGIRRGGGGGGGGRILLKIQIKKKF